MNRCVLEINIPQTPIPAYKKLPEAKKSRKSTRASKPLISVPSYHYDADFFTKYRSLIEKNYQKSRLKEYVFPRNPPAGSPQSEQCLSRDSSIDSMRGVLVYRLNNQNKKPQTALEATASQRIFAETKEGIKRMFSTTPRNRHAKLKNRSLSPVCFAGGESERYMEARKTADRRIFFVYCTKFKQREAGYGRNTLLTNRRLKTAHHLTLTR